MAIKCKGCGIELQYDRPNELGYSPKKEAAYCQRCFRLTHYDDIQISMKKGIDEDQVIQQAASIPGLVVWVADCFDFENALLHGMKRHFIGKKIVLAITKCDLLPKTVKEEKLYRYFVDRLKEWQLQPVGICFMHRGNQDDLEELKEMIRLFRNNQDVLFMGKANAGKSTLLNGLLNSNQLTVTRYPGTTLDFNEIQMEDWKLIDTPGLLNKESILMQIKDSDLKTVLPDARIKPQIYQLWEPQSFALAGLARIDCFTKESTSAVFYVSERLSIHRGKQENADQLWSNHQNGLLSPSVEEEFKNWKSYTFNHIKQKSDICISGLGWITIEKEMDKVVVTVPNQVLVTIRKAMI